MRRRGGGGALIFDFSGKRVVVGGGSKGIGRAVALGFAEAGAAVSLCARGTAALEATRGAIARLGATVHAASCDLGDAASVEAYVGAAADALGGIDVLVANASAFGITDDERGWAASLAVDLLGTVRLLRAARPHLVRAVGAVVVVSSISGLRPSLRTPPYGAVKAALIHYVGSAAAALAREGVRVNAVAPGAVEFPGGVWARSRSERPELYRQLVDAIPFGRMARPEEIAATVLFLASPASRWVTGQTLVADGGQTLGA